MNGPAVNDSERRCESQMAKKRELKPCPFCGAIDDALIVQRGQFVTCATCNAVGPSTDESPEDIDAIQQWNHRARG